MTVMTTEDPRPTQVQMRKKKKKKLPSTLGTTFHDLYKLTGEKLGEGSYGQVETCKSVYDGEEFAVKIIEKKPGTFLRSKLLKEIEIYHMCRGQKNIIQLLEFFEEEDKFYLVFEKLNGGPLLEHIQRRKFLTESEASAIVRNLAEAIQFLHSRGIAHRDVKPDNVLCISQQETEQVKLCDFDLCSDPAYSHMDCLTTPSLSTPVGSLEYMAPEVVNTFLEDDCSDYDEEFDDDSLRYNKKCDLWSLGVIAYILLCGYAPFQGECGAQCGWERGEPCTQCQQTLFCNITECRLVFPNQHWAGISAEAKDLIMRLLVKDSAARLTAEEVLSHSWIVNQGSTVVLHTPVMLNKHKTSIKYLEDCTTKILEAGRALGDVVEVVALSSPLDIPARRPTMSFNLSPINVSTCDLIQRRRRKSKELFSKFMSIDELETDFFMKAIS